MARVITTRQVLRFHQRIKLGARTVECRDARIGDGMRRIQVVDGGEHGVRDRIASFEWRDVGAEQARGLGEIENGIERERRFEQGAVAQVLAGAKAIQRIDDGDEIGCGRNPGRGHGLFS